MPSTATNEPTVTIKPKAYLKMLKHVLRFGSMAKKKSQMKECMGMLFGKLGELKGTVRDVVIVDVVEVTHGGHIEVSFEDRDYVSFAEINERYAAEGIFNVGWYHSHPGLTVFLSTVDVRNHLGFQTTNPSAIAIVWDHVLLEEPNGIGFETFRLTELGKGQYSDYKAVKTIVEPPDSKDFYKYAIKDIMDLQLGGNPPMFELNELPSVISDFDPTPIDDAKFTPPVFNSTLSNTNPAKINSAQLSPSLVVPFSVFINNWSQDVGQSLKNKNVVLNQNLSALKDTIEKQVKSIQIWFSEQANQVFLDIWEKADTEIENCINASKPTLDAIQNKYVLPEDKQSLLNSDITALIQQLEDTKKKADSILSKIKVK